MIFSLRSPVLSVIHVSATIVFMPFSTLLLPLDTGKNANVVDVVALANPIPVSVNSTLSS